jgi:hypothetical protein
VSAASNEEFRISLHRHNLARKKLNGDESAVEEALVSLKDADSQNDGTASQENTSKSPEGESEAANSDSALPGDSSERDRLFEKFSEVLDESVEQMENYTCKLKIATTVPGLEMEFSEGQAKVIDRIDSYWSRFGCGAVLGGTMSSGKTISACTLLWKKRSDGPQLLLCSHASLVRLWDDVE